MELEKRIRLLATAYHNQLVQFGVNRNHADEYVHSVFYALDNGNIREARHKLEIMKNKVEEVRRQSNEKESDIIR